jgi:hypothetical protein
MRLLPVVLLYFLYAPHGQKPSSSKSGHGLGPLEPTPFDCFYCCEYFELGHAADLTVNYRLILLENSNIWISRNSAKSPPLLKLIEDCRERRQEAATAL